MIFPNRIFCPSERRFAPQVLVLAVEDCLFRFVIFDNVHLGPKAEMYTAATYTLQYGVKNSRQQKHQHVTTNKQCKSKFRFHHNDRNYFIEQKTFLPNQVIYIQFYFKMYTLM